MEAFCKQATLGGKESGLPGAHFHLIDVGLEKMLIFFFFFWSTGDREQSGLLCNPRLCPADNTRGINCPCPAQALEGGAAAASSALVSAPQQLHLWPSYGWRSREPVLAPLLLHKEQPWGSPLPHAKGVTLSRVRRGLPEGL